MYRCCCRTARRVCLKFRGSVFESSSLLCSGWYAYIHPQTRNTEAPPFVRSCDEKNAFNHGYCCCCTMSATTPKSDGVSDTSTHSSRQQQKIKEKLELHLSCWDYVLLCSWFLLLWDTHTHTRALTHTDAEALLVAVAKGKA